MRAHARCGLAAQVLHVQHAGGKSRPTPPQRSPTLSSAPPFLRCAQWMRPAALCSKIQTTRWGATRGCPAAARSWLNVALWRRCPTRPAMLLRLANPRVPCPLARLASRSSCPLLPLTSRSAWAGECKGRPRFAPAAQPCAAHPAAACCSCWQACWGPAPARSRSTDTGRLAFHRPATLPPSAGTACLQRRCMPR